MKKLKIWKILSASVFLPLGLVILVFTVVNRQPVVINFWPFPVDMAVPLSFVIMLVLILGVFWGGWVARLTTRNTRMQGRDLEKRAGRAEAEVGKLKDKITAREAELSDTNRSIVVKDPDPKSLTHSSSNLT